MIENKIIKITKNKKKGIPMDEFINYCLFDKEGYYNKFNPIGKKGDFITAPEISQLFGNILGLYLLNIWQIKYKSKLNFIELGPGNGTLLIDILNTTKKFLNFHDSLNIYLLEKNNL